MRKTYIEAKAKNEQLFLRKHSYRVTGRMFSIDKEGCLYNIYVYSDKGKTDTRDIIFEVAKLAKNNIYTISDSMITIKFSIKYKFERKQKRELLEQIHDYLRHCR